MRIIVIKLLLCFCVIVNADAIELSLTDAHGSQHSVSDYRGKWVVVNYWATWCAPCLKEIPELIKFHNKHKNVDAVVLGVNYEKIAKQELIQFINKHKIIYTVLTSKPGEKPIYGPINGLPVTYLISPEGVLLAERGGGITVLDLEEGIGFYKDQISINGQ